MKGWAWLAAVVLVAVYGAYPYFTLYRIQAAIEDRDVVALDTYVDWPAVRAGVKSDFQAEMATALMKGENGSDRDLGARFAAGVATILMPAIIDRAVDAMVSSQALLNAAAQDDSNSTAKGKLWDYVSYAFFSSPTDFRVDVRNPREPDGPKLLALMSLTGATWRVTRVHLPLSTKDLPAKLSPGSAKSAPQRAEEPPPPQPSLATPEPQVAAIPPAPTPQLKSEKNPEPRKILAPMVSTPPEPKPRSEPDQAGNVVKEVARTAKPVTSSLDGKMTMSEIDAVRRQIERCWNVPAGAKDAKNLVVDIHVAMNPDGTVREATVVDQARMQSDGSFRRAAESARRAIYLCQPLKLPPEKYLLWQDMTLSFNPSQIL
jgi:outer membrane biosynthesis protein TonB